MPLQIGGFRLMFATSKQVESPCKRLTERGRGSAPGSSGNEMTGHLRRQGLARDQPDGFVLPRTAACGSVNGIEWTLAGRSAESLGARFFLNKCMQICACGFS